MLEEIETELNALVDHYTSFIRHLQAMQSVVLGEIHYRRSLGPESEHVEADVETSQEVEDIVRSLLEVEDSAPPPLVGPGSGSSYNPDASPPMSPASRTSEIPEDSGLLHWVEWLPQVLITVNSGLTGPGIHLRVDSPPLITNANDALEAITASLMEESPE
jgi:hypothetical protein